MYGTTLDWSKEGILLTGGRGFLGSVVYQKLKERGAKTIYRPRRSEYDLTMHRDVQLLYEDKQPSVVLHLAAEVGGIGANRDNPGRYFYANMSMGLNLIEGARRNGVKKFVQVGTICAYPNETPVPFKEEDLWEGYPEVTNAPYGIAKKALLVMLQAYRTQYNLNGIYLLPVNLYGPGDNFDLESSHVIPAMIRKFTHAWRYDLDTVSLWGTGSASREFLYVDDCAEGLLMAAEEYNRADPVNLGTGEEITIKDLAQEIKALVGFKGGISWDPSKPDGQPRRCLDTSLAEVLFAFRARTSFGDGLKKTIDWWVNEGIE